MMNVMLSVVVGFVGHMAFVLLKIVVSFKQDQELGREKSFEYLILYWNCNTNR